MIPFKRIRPPIVLEIYGNSLLPKNETKDPINSKEMPSPREESLVTPNS